MHLSLLLPPVALGLLASGCSFEFFSFHEPIRAVVSVTDVEPSRVHAALFSADPTVRILADDGAEEAYDLALHVEGGGRIGLLFAPELPRAIALEPLRTAEGAVGPVTFVLPALTETTS